MPKVLHEGRRVCGLQWESSSVANYEREGSMHGKHFWDNSPQRSNNRSSSKPSHSGNRQLTINTNESANLEMSSFLLSPVCSIDPDFFSDPMEILSDAPKSSTEHTRKSSMTSPKELHQYTSSAEKMDTVHHEACSGDTSFTFVNHQSTSAYHSNSNCEFFIPQLNQHTGQIDGFNVNQSQIHIPALIMRLSDEYPPQILECNMAAAQLFGQYLLEQSSVTQPSDSPYHPLCSAREELSAILSDFHRYVLQYAKWGKRFVRIGQRYFEETFVLHANALWHCTYAEAEQWQDSLLLVGHNGQILLDLAPMCDRNALYSFPQIPILFAMRISTMMQNDRMQREYVQRMEEQRELLQRHVVREHLRSLGCGH
eukprot:CAMPEP_0117445088 /NCGR_PEP_ID=MMETSP0759-20121206/5602_1 /TAXON_ID=63605 /ORGANISM="Percolomonas cosmopolitus, Strain WS" /LENGTH=368 /DNA_ID=CAMNT_0005237227 /DNA_START=130 /DNA_END=1237 /DNA_ORIENTATION=-